MTDAASAGGSIRPGRLAVGVIGPGRVGAVLGAALAAVQHRVVAVAAVSEQSRSRAAAMIPSAAVLTPPEVCEASDLVLVTVPDDELPSLVRGLSDIGAWRSGQLVMHTCGRHGVGVLAPAASAGAVPLALHPVMTFTGTSLDLDRLVDCVFGVTAPAAFLPIADALVLEMGGEPVHVAEEQRPLYHAALAHAANHVIALVTSSAELLHEAGVDDQARVLGPLLSAALDNALRLGDAALTGPVARGDAGTVAEHLAAIGAVSNDSRQAYAALARLTAERAMGAGLLDAGRAEPLLDVLLRHQDGP